MQKGLAHPQLLGLAVILAVTSHSVPHLLIGLLLSGVFIGLMLLCTAGAVHQHFTSLLTWTYSNLSVLALQHSGAQSAALQRCVLLEQHFKSTPWSYTAT